MRAAGRELHTALGLRAPKGIGILRSKDEAEAAAYEDKATAH